MPEVQSTKHIGMQRVRALENLSESEQLDLIAEGLPILVKSADGLSEAANQLDEHPRSAAMLRCHADEEVAKILILIDLVRCPATLRASRTRNMIRWFYDHLARLIYIEAQNWKPIHISQLQDYVDTHRRSHYLEGEYGEYILPNWEIYRRESDLYADIVGGEDGSLIWNDPQSTYTDPVTQISSRDSNDSCSWHICKALQGFGCFTRRGLELVSDTWVAVDFRQDKNFKHARNLTYEMACALQKANLISENANEDLLQTLYHQWQLPMYNIDFSRIKVSLEELQRERDNMFWSEMGY